MPVAPHLTEAARNAVCRYDLEVMLVEAAETEYGRTALMRVLSQPSELLGSDGHYYVFRHLNICEDTTQRQSYVRRLLDAYNYEKDRQRTYEMATNRLDRDIAASMLQPYNGGFGPLNVASYNIDITLEQQRLMREHMQQEMSQMSIPASEYRPVDNTDLNALMVEITKAGNEPIEVAVFSPLARNFNNLIVEDL
jgi:hypothetical protein